jgi:hypothetical protein
LNNRNFKVLKVNIRWLKVLWIVTATICLAQVHYNHIFGPTSGAIRSGIMLDKITIAIAAASLLGAAAIPTDALAFGHGGGGGHGGFGGGFHGGFGGGHGGFGGGGFSRGFAGHGFGGGGFSRGFAGHGFAGHGFAGHGFAGHGFGGRGFGHGFNGHRFARFGAPGIGLGLGLGYGVYGNYDDACYAWTPYGYQWVCDYPY